MTTYNNKDAMDEIINTIGTRVAPDKMKIPTFKQVSSARTGTLLCLKENQHTMLMVLKKKQVKYVAIVLKSEVQRWPVGTSLEFRLPTTVAENESPYIANTQEYASLIRLAKYQLGKPFPQLTKVYCGNTKHTPLNTGEVVVLPSGEECVFIQQHNKKRGAELQLLALDGKTTWWREWDSRQQEQTNHRIPPPSNASLPVANNSVSQLQNQNYERLIKQLCDENVCIKTALLAQLQCDATFRKGFPHLATLLQADQRTTEKPVFVEIPRAERDPKRQRTL